MPRNRTFLTLTLAATFATYPAELVKPFWDSLTVIWTVIGCNIDPHGGCEPGQGEEGSLAPEPDLGHGIDPHG